jgi:hypothetical protein
MARAECFAVASHPQRGRLWAAVDANTVQSEGRVAERRFSAFLAPFRSLAAAQAALVAAGGKLEGTVA